MRVQSMPRRFIGPGTAILIVVANMIGTGVFTTLGLQAAAVADGAALLLLWLIGGVVALCGALCYAELAAALPRSGGEYHFLSRIYHPSLGRLAGWVSVTLGFSAPVALASMALGRYAGTSIPLDPIVIAVAALGLVTALHAFDLAIGGAFQVAATLVKVLVVLLFALAGLASLPVPGSLSPMPTASSLEAVFSAPFALALVYVSYAYSGWNAVVYVVDEVRAPGRTVPWALILGTGIVTALYVLLNAGFLRTTDGAELAGTVEVGALSARNLFGPEGGALVSLVLSLLLVSTISAMVLAGPRVLTRIGEDLPALRFLSRRNRRGAPTRAVLLQQGLALAFILTDSFEAVLTLAGFTLSLFALLTVGGVVRLRLREPGLARPFRVPLYPLPPLLFLLVTGASLALAVPQRPVSTLAVLALLLLGWCISPGRGTGST